MNFQIFRKINTNLIYKRLRCIEFGNCAGYNSNFFRIGYISIKIIPEYAWQSFYKQTGIFDV